MAGHFGLLDETMSSLPPQEDMGTDTDKMEEIGKNLTKHIRYLESWVNQFKKIPSRKVMLKKFKNEVWHKMCKPCRSKLYDLQGTDFPYLRDIHTQTSIIPPGLQIDFKGEYPTRQPNSSDKRSKKEQQSSNIPHPLKDQEDKEDLEELNDILRQTIRTQKMEIKKMESQLEKEKMKAKNTNGGPVTETKRDQTGDHEAAYWHTFNDDLDKENKRLKRELDQAKAHLDSIMKERDDCVKKTAQQQILTGGRKSFSEDQDYSIISLSDIPTEKQIMSSQTDIDINEETSCKIGRQEQDLDGLSKELEKNIDDLDKTEGYLRDISALQTEKQTLEDTLTRTKEEMASATESMQQEIDRLNTELQEMNNDLGKVRGENEENKREVSILQAEKQRSISYTTEKLQREVDSLTAELEKAKNDLEKAQGEREEYKNEIFEQQAEKQTLTDTLKRTGEDMSSNTERLQQDVDRLMRELEKNKDELKELKEGNKRHELEISEREDEKQTLQETLDKTKDEMSFTKRNLQQEVDRLTEALEKNKDELKEKTKRHEQEISEREAEKQTLQETLNTTKDEMSSTKKNLQQEVDRLTEALEKNKDELQEKTKKHEQEISEREAERETLQETLNTTKDEMSSTNKNLEREVHKVTQALEKNKDELKEVTKRHEQEISEREDEKQTLQETLNKTVDEMSSTQRNLQQEVDRLTGALEKNKDELQEKTKRHEQEISEREAERETLQETLNTTKDEMSSTNKNLEREVHRLTEALAGKNEDIKKLKDALEESQRLQRKIVVMRLLKTSGSGLGKAMVDMVYKELNRKLNGRFDSRNFDFSIVLSEATKDASNRPLFVLCLNMSRVGTNIMDAMEGIKGKRDVYVLVLHHTNKENLSQLTPTGLRVSGSEMRQLGGIIDMAFSSESGLYDCYLNNNAIDKIVTTLNRY
ncbi:golgin subfamily A member 6-like protein 25 isoform X2 [Argopecten irradians]|uniref:golgin subfamily A member 6-like protein 25 isoform X2 n=1 Tax=Argopecten irradians TaxID=31199 RepID=UPI00371C4179